MSSIQPLGQPFRVNGVKVSAGLQEMQRSQQYAVKVTALLCYSWLAPKAIQHGNGLQQTGLYQIQLVSGVTGHCFALNVTN